MYTNESPLFFSSWFCILPFFAFCAEREKAAADAYTRALAEEQKERERRFELQEALRRRGIAAEIVRQIYIYNRSSDIYIYDYRSSYIQSIELP